MTKKNFRKKILSFATSLALAFGLLMPNLSIASVGITTGPSSLLADPVNLKASSNPLGLFEFTLSSDAGENLSGVSVNVNQNATTTVSSGDLASISLYKDDGNGSFNSTVDILVGTQSTVNIGSGTMVAPSTTTPASGKFFVSMSTSASWSGAVPADSVKVTLPNGSILTTASIAPTTTSVTTASIMADTTGPVLMSAIAKNTGGTNNKEAGDSVVLEFSENTNKPTINSSTINSFFSVNNSHSFLDAGGNLGVASWNTAGTALTITLSGTSTPTSTLPSIVVGDVISVVASSSFTDLAGNQASGTQALSGNFGGQSADDDLDDDERVKGMCANGLKNGLLYKVGSEPTVYLAAACRLKPFRGNAVFKARGKKFQEIIVLPSLPSGVSISQKPVLPNGGTLIKGSGKTVWFVGKNGKRRGFVSGNHFLGLGFNFTNVQTISDSDLTLVPIEPPIQTNENHPDGAMIKCSNQPTVFQVIGGKKFPFVSLAALETEGVNVNQVLIINCKNFQYQQGAPVN